MNKPLRILMVLHMPWSRNLGGPRVQLELAEEFRAMGHEVEKFDYYDAFPQAKLSSRMNAFLFNLFRPRFSVKAKAFVQANAHRFDIIDAHQGNLPFTKEELSFKGLLVARSVGLYALYEQFAKSEQAQNSPKTIKAYLGNLLSFLQQKRENPLYLRSLQTSDLINVPNHDELAYIRDTLGLGYKCVAIPFGLSQQRQQLFAQAIKPAALRLANKQVVFIGSWGLRKGAKDWAEIIQEVKQQVPEASFLFLGTGFSSEKVLEDIKLPACKWIEIIPCYDSQELPKLLSKATVGAFPSYIEGFPFAMLEKLASGIPTVAYDVPGPRETLHHCDNSLLVPAGDVKKFSRKLVNLLSFSDVSYTQLSQKCMEVAKKFDWHKISKETLDLYSQFLEVQK